MEKDELYMVGVNDTMAEITGISKINNRSSYEINGSKNLGSSDFSSFLGESRSMDEIFSDAAEKYNVPTELLKAVGKAESNFNPNAVSRSGAQGVMQLMPATAKELGVSNSFDAEQNINGGAKYISTLLKRYDGNTKLALAAYNAGSGNVAKYNGIPPFEETQNYVKKVMGYFGQGNIEIAANNSAGSPVSTGPSVSYINKLQTVTPVQSNYGFLITNHPDSDSTGIDDLNALFSYDDYMKFIDLFLKEDETEEASDKKEEGNQTKFSAGEINYSASVINLLKDQNII